MLTAIFPCSSEGATKVLVKSEIGPSLSIHRGKFKLPTPIPLRKKLELATFVLSHKPSWAGCFAGDIDCRLGRDILSTPILDTNPMP